MRRVKKWRNRMTSSGVPPYRATNQDVGTAGVPTYIKGVDGAGGCRAARNHVWTLGQMWTSAAHKAGR
ncbi:hypothetical protein TRIP_C20167 [Candidatus Zixiibacteriota bacterium]|nr:hypothetical protein TRIP_C20167 [candidate division Zixibacteria bacterium]